jgi:hypothetical protein
MRYRKLISKFTSALQQLYSAATAPTTARERRLDAEVRARAGTFDSAMAAAITRDVRRSQLAAARKNTRGLPKGYGRHDLRRARKIRHRAKFAPEGLSLTSIERAETFFADLRRCNALRRALRPHTGPSAPSRGRLKGAAPGGFLRRVMPGWRSLTPRQIAARVSKHLLEARETGRVPYVKPPAKSGMVPARARRRADGSLSVTPVPLPITGGAA